jgi:hypothetical protein
VLVVPFVVCLIRSMPEVTAEIGSDTDVGEIVGGGDGEIGREAVMDKR